MFCSPTLVEQNVRVSAIVVEHLNAFTHPHDLADLSIGKVASGLGTATRLGVGLNPGTGEITHWAPATVLGHVEGPAVAGLAYEYLGVGYTRFGNFAVSQYLCCSLGA